MWRTNLHLNIDLANEDELCSGNITDSSIIKWVSNIGQIAAEAEHRLHEGKIFDKFCVGNLMGKVKKHPRMFKLSEDGKRMCWYKVGKGGKLTSEKLIEMSEVSYVEAGLGFVNAKKGIEVLSLRFGNPMREICVQTGDEAIKAGFIADVWAVQYYEGLMRCQERLGEIIAKKVGDAGGARGNLKKVLDRGR